MSETAALILMCGMSFSGKSTLSRRLAEELDATILSLDAINEERGLFGGQGIPVEEWEKTHRIADERAGVLLRAGRDVIVDDTGSPRFVRDRWRSIAAREHARFELVWVTIDTALQESRLLANRDSGDRHDVTDRVMAEHRAAFEPPTEASPIVVDGRDVLDPGSVDRVLREIRAGGAPAV